MRYLSHLIILHSCAFCQEQFQANSESLPSNVWAAQLVILAQTGQLEHHVCRKVWCLFALLQQGMLFLHILAVDSQLKLLHRY